MGTALLGLLAGLWMRSRRPVAAKSLGLAAGAAICLATGYFWSLSFPLNKNLWTSSFVLVAAGWSLVVLALAYWAVEQNGWRKGWTYPWLVFGSNAITAYMFSELVPGILYNINFTAGGRKWDVLSWFFEHSFAHIPDPGWAAFAYSVFVAGFCFVPVWMLYRKRIFLKV
jgi:predicted acyltransferase